MQSPMASATYLSTPSTSSAAAASSSAAVTASLSPDDFGSPPGTPARTLRRKRSSANAALTTRPSILSLRNRSASTSSSSNGHGGGNVGDSMASIDAALSELQLAPSPMSRASTPTATRPADSIAARTSSHSQETAMAELVVSSSTLVLVHAVEKKQGKDRRGSRSLAHALFAPNLLVDAQGRVSSLTRTQWERARATVEEARIVRLGGVVGGSTRSPTQPVSSLSSENKTKQSAKLETVFYGGEGEGREHEEVVSTTSCTTFYLQARAAADQVDLIDAENFDIREREDEKKLGNPGHYLEIVIRSLENEQTRAHLPSQLRALLEQSDSFTFPQTQARRLEAEEDKGNQELCNEILDLVKTKAL